MQTIRIERQLSGSILDIGGGGECVIGRLYSADVVAIDNQQEELDEAPDGVTKLLMDATMLDFEDRSFDNITFFYSLMYMQPEVQEKAIHEAYRVLKPGGRCLVWDAVIDSAYPEPFFANLRILIGDKILKTSYGVVKKDASQDLNSITNLFVKAGFAVLSDEDTEEGFNLNLWKNPS